jgi:hypothetical protein
MRRSAAVGGIGLSTGISSGWKANADHLVKHGAADRRIPQQLMSPDPWARLYRKDTIYRGLADELLVIAGIIHRAQQFAAALESSAAHQAIRRRRLTEIQQAKDEFRALVDDLQVGALVSCRPVPSVRSAPHRTISLLNQPAPKK